MLSQVSQVFSLCCCVMKKMARVAIVATMTKAAPLMVSTLQVTINSSKTHTEEIKAIVLMIRLIKSIFYFS